MRSKQGGLQEPKMNHPTPSRTSSLDSLSTSTPMRTETRIVRTVLRTIAVLMVVYAIYRLGSKSIMLAGIWKHASSFRGFSDSSFQGNLGQMSFWTLIVDIFLSFLGHLLFKFSENLALLITRD